MTLKLAAEHAAKILDSVISSESGKSTDAIGDVIITAENALGTTMPKTMA